MPGADEVEGLVTGVSAQPSCSSARPRPAPQLVLCHHGIFWDFHPRAITPALKRRLETLFAADMSLAAYHLPLDAHPEVGNNALICAALGLERGEPFGDAKGRPLGFVGRSAEGVPFAELRERCRAAFGQEPFVWDAGPEVVHSARRRLRRGARRRSPRRSRSASTRSSPASRPSTSMADAREAGIHFIAGGHYATETFGVRRLGELLAERFGVEHRFIDVPNPI